jgi:glycosyltransferase involved in cell wall biosynthesis
LPSTVLFLHSSAGRYGADLQLLSLASGLDRDAYEPVAVLPERGELGPLLEEAGVDVVVHPLAVLRRRASSVGAALPAILRDRRELGRLARERGAAIIHSNTSVVLSGRSIARRAGARHVLHVREIYAGVGGAAARAVWPVVRRRMLQADAVLCISRAVASQFGRAPGVEVVYDGLPRKVERAERTASRRELGLPGDRFVAALLGRVSDWKGQDVLARALAEPALAEIGAVGLVAGDAFPGNERYERGLAELRNRLALGDRLRLLGFQADLPTLLGAADALAVPSTRPEPLGLVALEAGAAGVPVVASAHGGLPEVVRDGETGLLAPPGDPAALAAALRRLADDPALAGRMGAAAASDVPARFGRDRMLAQVQAVYERLGRS